MYPAVSCVTVPVPLAGASELADGSGDPALRGQSRFGWSGALLTAGEATRARQLLEEAEQIAEVDGSPLLVWEVRSYLAHHLAMAGDLAGAEAAAQASLEAGPAPPEPPAPCWWAGLPGTAPRGRPPG